MTFTDITPIVTHDPLPFENFLFKFDFILLIFLALPSGFLVLFLIIHFCILVLIICLIKFDFALPKGMLDKRGEFFEFMTFLQLPICFSVTMEFQIIAHQSIQTDVVQSLLVDYFKT